MAFNMAHDLAATTLVDSIEHQNEEYSALAFLNIARDLSKEADLEKNRGVDFLKNRY